MNASPSEPKDGRCFSSWSGGKDSILALHRVNAARESVRALLTMMIEDGTRSRSHGLRRVIIEAQARALRLPIQFVSASWNDYEAQFASALRELFAKGFTVGVYGDIDIPEHRAWVERVNSDAGIRVLEPLWQEDRRALLEEFLDLGFRARIVAIREDRLPAKLLGQELSSEVVRQIVECGADPTGENGEYHTVAFDGPLFVEPIRLEPGEQVRRDGYWFQDFTLAGTEDPTASLSLAHSLDTDEPTQR